jgi:hypothetical protein
MFYDHCRLKSRRQINHAVKYAYELEIQVVGEKVLQGMNFSLLEDGSSGSIEINLDKLR